MPGTRLTAAEMAALDLVIQVMKSRAGSYEAPASFINDIVNVTQKVINVAQQVTPIVPVVTAIGVAGPADTASQFDDVLKQLPPGVTLDQLIQLRNSISRG